MYGALAYESVRTIYIIYEVCRLMIVRTEGAPPPPSNFFYSFTCRRADIIYIYIATARACVWEMRRRRRFSDIDFAAAALSFPQQRRQRYILNIITYKTIAIILLLYSDGGGDDSEERVCRQQHIIRACVRKLCIQHAYNNNMHARTRDVCVYIIHIYICIYILYVVHTALT